MGLAMRSGLQWILMVAIGWYLGCADKSDSQSSSSADSGSTAQSQTQPQTSAADSNPSMNSKAPDSPSEETQSAAELAAKGRGIYMANCIACHNVDATKDGALGPAVAGASLELLEARVIRGDYPAGYIPKRDTRVMVPLRHLERNLGELVAYLDSLE